LVLCFCLVPRPFHLQKFQTEMGTGGCGSDCEEGGVRFRLLTFLHCVFIFATAPTSDSPPQSAPAFERDLRGADPDCQPAAQRLRPRRPGSRANRIHGMRLQSMLVGDLDQNLKPPRLYDSGLMALLSQNSVTLLSPPTGALR